MNNYIKQISFNSVVPPSTASHLLAFRQLKSYILHKGMKNHIKFYMNLYGTNTPDPQIITQILGQSINIAAFSSYVWNMPKLIEICNSIKKEKPEILIVLGGPYASFMADTLISNSGIDLIIKGSGEETFYRVVKKIAEDSQNWYDIPNVVYKEGSKIITTPIHYDFDVSKQLYDLCVEDGDSSYFWYETSRGCPFKCRYCSWNSEQKRQIKYYPYEKIEKDLKAIFNLKYVKHLEFCDSDIFLKKNHGIQILQYIHQFNEERRKRNWPEINIYFETNPEFIDEEAIHEISKLPVGQTTISCGLQTINEHVNNYHLNRNFHKDKYIHNLKRLCEGVKQNVSIEIIYGLPGDTYESFKQTVNFLVSEIKFKRFVSAHFLVLPGSYFWDHYEDFNLIFSKKSPHRLISSNTFSEEEISKAKRLTFFMYLFNTILFGIKRAVTRQAKSDYMTVYDKIINHIELNYPQFISELYCFYEKNEDIETILKLLQYTANKNLINLRYDIINEARQIIKNYLLKQETTI